MSEIIIPKPTPTYQMTSTQADRLNRRPSAPLDEIDRNSRSFCATRLFHSTIYAFGAEMRGVGHLFREAGAALRYTVLGQSEIAGWHATWALDQLGALLLRPIAQSKDAFWLALGTINPNLAWEKEEK